MTVTISAPSISRVSPRPHRAWQIVGGEQDREPLRGVAWDCRQAYALVGRRARRSGCSPTLEAGAGGRRPGRAAVGRAGHRQVAHRGGAAGEDDDEPHVCLRCLCSPYHVDSAFYPYHQPARDAADLAGTIRRTQAQQTRNSALEVVGSTRPTTTDSWRQDVSIPCDGALSGHSVSPPSGRRKRRSGARRHDRGMHAASPL